MGMELFEPQYFASNSLQYFDNNDLSAYVSDEGVKLVDKVICNLQVAKNFQENTDTINSIDFSKSGEVMVSAAEDDQIIVYNCESGTISRNLKSKKYGVSHIQCTHAANTILHASTKIDDTIRYLSLHDNKYLRYFQGHTERVTGLSMSPTDDRFLSTSLDKTLRLWDLRTPHCHGLMKLQERSVASIDPEGLVFAVLMNGDSIKLYDIRTFDKGPFTTFQLPLQPTSDDCASLKFSPCGKQIMLTKIGSNTIRVLDAFEGKPLHTLTGHRVTQKTLTVEASYTPNSAYIFSGSEDGKVHVWSSISGKRLCILNGGHPRPVQCLRFNPKYMMMASSCTDMALWIPRIDVQ